MPKTGPHARWGSIEDKRKEPKPVARTIILRHSACTCKPGSCEKAAIACKDWIKRAVKQGNKR